MLTTLFDTIGRLCVTWPWRVLALCGLLALGALPFVGQLALEADVRNMLPGDMAQTLERHNTLFGSSDLALLLVQTAQGSPDDLIAFGMALQQQLGSSALIRRVEFGYALPVLTVLGEVALDYAPFFVRPDQIDALDRLLTPEGITAQIHKTLLDLSLPGANPRDRLLLEDPLQLRAFAFARLLALRGTFHFDAASPYFLSQDGRALLIRVEGQASVHDMAGVKATVALLQQVTSALLALPAFQDLTLQTTGGYFFAAESERTIRQDIMRNLNLSAVLICIFTAWAFRRWDVFLYAQLPTLVSLWLALGVFALVHPQLNALALGCAAGLIGIGDDYTIHILTHYFEAHGHGRPTQDALRAIVRETGGGLLLAALATAAAFSAFLVAEQPFLQDMGLLAALGIGWCCLLCLTFLPALLVCLPARRRPRRPRAMGIPVLLTSTLRASRWVLGLSLALCLGAVAALLWWPPGFETDLRNIHAMPSPTLQTQEKLAALFGGSQEPLMLIIEGVTEEHVMQDLHRLEPALLTMVAEGVLAAVTSPSLLYPDPRLQAEVLRRLRHKDAGALMTVLTTRLEEAGFDVTALHAYLSRVQHALTLHTPLDLSAFRALGFGELLRSSLAQDATGAVGLALLFPARDLWTQDERQVISQRLTRLLTELDVHGSLSGLYTISATSAARIGADFRRITLLAAAWIVVLVALQFRHFPSICLALLPVGCGTLWTAGLFALCGWKLNFMNIAILPMLLGLGIDFGIYMMHQVHRHGRSHIIEAVQLTGVAIGLSAFTTQLAFGTLALSRNQGLASVGVVTLVGITACLLASLFTLPAAWQAWTTHLEKRHGLKDIKPL
jgi:predicted RND superfamily exporter protein